jgi:alpha-mannosidase
VALRFDRATASAHDTPAASGFDGSGRALPGEMLPEKLPFGGIEFTLNPGADGTPNALVARGQSVSLPAGSFRRVYVLAASADGDRHVTFRAGTKAVDVTVQHWGGYIGQWDNRTWTTREVPDPRRPGRTETMMEYTGLVPGYVKPAPVAWFASHRHTAAGKHEAYAYSYLFAHAIDLPPGATSLTLPEDDRIRVLAITVAEEAGSARPVQPLSDTLQRQ